MRVLLTIGAFLVVFGLGGMMRACVSSPYAIDNDVAATGPTPGAGADGDDAGGAQMMLGIVSGLALAIGAGCFAIGMGRWQRPTPSATRPANPWSEQPADKGDPPVGLV